MEILQEIIRGIALIIVFAAFMEMLLPDSEMRRYIQVIVGLFVIVSLVTPIARFMDTEKSFVVASWQRLPDDNTKELIDKGTQIAKEQEQKLTTEADKRVETQIDALAKLHGGVKEAEVEVLKNTIDNTVKVKIKLITDDVITAEEKSKLSEQVSETITAFFDYPAENIEIGF